MLIEQIQEDLTKALKDKNELQISTLRLLMSEIHNRAIEKQKDPSDEELVLIIRKEVKKRQESAEVYAKGGRKELADKENEEAKILSRYLPQQMSLEELDNIIKEVIGEESTTGTRDFGRVMGVVMNRVKGRIDGAKVSEAVKRLL